MKFLKIILKCFALYLAGGTAVTFGMIVGACVGSLTAEKLEKKFSKKNS